MDKQDMQGVTGAVRSYIDNASEEEKNKKSHQQKWGLFETNYQRNKGISTEESLQEIEDFCGGNGPNAVDGQGKSWVISGKPGAVSTTTTTTTTTHYSGAPGSAGYTSVKPGSSSSTAGSTTTTFGQSGNMKFGPGGNAGDAFFSQHQDKTKAKYKPQNSLFK